MQPRTPQERQRVIDAHPHLTAEEIDCDLEELDRLCSQRMAVDPTVPDAGKKARETRIRELTDKLF